MTGPSHSTPEEAPPWLRLALYRAELGAIQARLGTSAERPYDMERARSLAHDIANVRTALQLGDIRATE
jgi:hypothetical protein